MILETAYSLVRGPQRAFTLEIVARRSALADHVYSIRQPAWPFIQIQGRLTTFQWVPMGGGPHPPSGRAPRSRGPSPGHSRLTCSALRAKKKRRTGRLQRPRRCRRRGASRRASRPRRRRAPPRRRRRRGVDRGGRGEKKAQPGTPRCVCGGEGPLAVVRRCGSAPGPQGRDGAGRQWRYWVRRGRGGAHSVGGTSVHASRVDPRRAPSA